MEIDICGQRKSSKIVPGGFHHLTVQDMRKLLESKNIPGLHKLRRQELCKLLMSLQQKSKSPSPSKSNINSSSPESSHNNNECVYSPYNHTIIYHVINRISEKVNAKHVSKKNIIYSPFIFNKGQGK